MTSMCPLTLQDRIARVYPSQRRCGSEVDLLGPETPKRCIRDDPTLGDQHMGTHCQLEPSRTSATAFYLAHRLLALQAVFGRVATTAPVLRQRIV